jgi:hypothetical protein
MDPPKPQRERVEASAVMPGKPKGAGYALKAFQDEIDLLMAAREPGRNNALNAASFSLGQLVASGDLDRAQVRAALLNAAEAIGLGESESLKTITSGLTAGAAKPRVRGAA